MRKFLSLCVIAAAASTLFAQDYHEPSKAALKYATYRTETTEPSYGLSKVKSLIKKIKTVEKDDGGNKILPDKQYDALSFKEKFTYAMLHAEEFAQNCDGMPITEDDYKHITAYPAGAWDNTSFWSVRQKKFLHDNRTKVIGLLRETIRAKHRVGANLKCTILELNAWELIPDMVTVYNRDHKDNDILSALMVLMKEAKYKPFLATPSYKKLYGEGASYQAFLNSNTANQKLEISRAMAFYNSKK